MSDLISRSALIEKFYRNSIYSHITNSEGKNILEIIQEMPTVFDYKCAISEIEKWIKEYKDAKSCDEIEGIYYSGIIRGYINSLEIIKSYTNAARVKEEGGNNV